MPISHLCLPYHPAFNDIIYPLKLLDFHVNFSYPNTIGKSLIRNSPKCERGIVYKIPCVCSRFYIGQTGKELGKRVDQHKSYVNNNMPNSALNIHHSICNNPIQWNRSSILYKSNNYIERNILESACIEFSKEVNINTS